MQLKKYNSKRSKEKTPEPFGGQPSEEALRFVVQKHDASHLHYDFRLEMAGVLKSWAIPKGPSTDPSTKRLALMVEDHPFDYRNFEGVIPEGEYGGGTVMIWDEGTYEPITEAKNKKLQEKELLKELKSGSLKFRLNGTKLKGEFALVKAAQMGENQWLLIKHRDSFASEKDIAAKDKSVLSGKSMAGIAKGRHSASSGKTKDKKAKAPAKKGTNKKIKPDTLQIPALQNKQLMNLLENADKSALPSNLSPMKATLVDEPFSDGNWLYEVKWDGYRAVSVIQKGKATLFSRNKLPFKQFEPVRKALENLPGNMVLDGEIVVLNEKGISDFNALQNWRENADGNLVYYVFDIPWFEGKDLQSLPLTDRLAVLSSILPQNNPVILRSETFDTDGEDFFKAAEKLGLEGIMAKRKQSTYAPGIRSKDWLKIKVRKRQEAVIAGYTKNEGSPKAFSSLILGLYDKDKLKYAGKVGTGFSDKLRKELLARFKPLITTKSPFPAALVRASYFKQNNSQTEITWLKPELICEVNYAEITQDKIFRQAAFKGMRIDKKAKEVGLEIPEATAKARKESGTGEKAAKPKQEGKTTPKNKRQKKELLDTTKDTQYGIIDGHELKFSHLNKLYWPEDGFTKRDLFDYYHQISGYILPYLKDRPMSLNRFPGGIHANSFYQKDVKGKVPEWAKTMKYITEEGAEKEYLLGNDEATLLWMVAQGCIEMNPWFSRVGSPDNPDYCVIDLDPGKNTSFDQVIEAAQAVHSVLDTMGIAGYPKTSGSTGIHIYIPLGAKYTYEQSKDFAHLVVTMVHQEIPDITSLERTIKQRKGKMYLDFLQNRPGATIAAPYSLRPRKGATVSMPLRWIEVKKGLRMEDFTIENAAERIKKEGDIFKPVLKKGIDIQKIVQIFSEKK